MATALAIAVLSFSSAPKGGYSEGFDVLVLIGVSILRLALRTVECCSWRLHIIIKHPKSF